MQDRTVAYGKQYGTRIAIGLAQQQSPRSTGGFCKVFCLFTFYSEPKSLYKTRGSTDCYMKWE
eukprot:scaffold134294_cov18-Tisochrysis_lutea.AAC.1